MWPKQRMFLAALAIHTILFSTPTTAKFLKIFPKGPTGDRLGFEVDSIDEEAGTISVTLNDPPMDLFVSYSKNLGDNGSTTYDQWDPEQGFIYWKTHSNYKDAANPLKIEHVVTGFYKFEINSVDEAAYYYMDTQLKKIEELKMPSVLELFQGGYTRDINNRQYFRLVLPTHVPRVLFRVMNVSNKKYTKADECLESEKEGDYFIYLCDLKDQFINNTRVLVTVDDIRCNQNSIWYFNDLQCKAIFVVSDFLGPSITPIDKRNDNDLSLHYIWIFGALCLMFMVVIIWLVLFIQRRRRRTQAPYGTRPGHLCFDCCFNMGSFHTPSTSSPIHVQGGDTSKIEIQDENSKREVVLLLWYSRDCEPFMDLMKEFREYLNKCKGFQVVDLYEETMLAQARELGLNRWVTQALGQVADHGHVLLIWSPCAQHIYTRIQPMGSIYRYPRWTDPAFLLGLAALQPNSTDLHIIPIGIESMSADPPPFLGSQYLNFQLPGHLSLLKSHLTGQTDSESDSDDGLLGSQLDSLGVTQQANSLQQFLIANRSYLKQLLDIES